MKFTTSVFLCLLFVVHFARANNPDYRYLFPKPNAENVSAQSKIFVRLHSCSPSSITNLSQFITVKSNDKRIAGQTKLASDNKTITFYPAAPFQAGAIVYVSLAPQASVSTEPFSFQFKVADFEMDAECFENESSLKKNESESITGGYAHTMPNGVSVPSDFPHVQVTTNNTTADGYLFVHNIRDKAPYNIIFDNNGSPVWYERWNDKELRRDFTVQKNGMITMTTICCNGRKYLGYDQNFNLIDEFNADDGFVHDGHELQVLENGNYLIIGRRNIKIDASRYVDKGENEAWVEETTVQEFTPDHQLIFNWPALEYLADGVPYLELDDPLDTSFRFPHFNAVDVDKDDENLLISSRMLSEVTKVDRESGDIIWRLGGQHSDFEFLNDPFNGFSCQHDIRSLGNNLYSVFDNGNYHTPPTSRGVVYELDLENMTATLVWQYSQPESKTYSTYMGNMQQLPNGNFFINWAVGELPKVSEVTTEGELVYEMNFEGKFDTYRTFRHPWEGAVEKPRLYVEQDDVSTILIFNKFGDTEVAYYKIYGGFEPHPTTVLDTCRTTLKRFTDLIEKRRYYFRVTAVDKDGNESDFSNERNMTVNYIEPGVNMLQNGTFKDENMFWKFAVTEAEASMRTVEGEMRIFVDDPGNYYESIQLRQENISLMQGRYYRLEFDAGATESRIIEAYLEQLLFPWNNYGKINPTALRRGMQHFTYDFKMEDPSDFNVNLVFNCGAMPGDVTIDNVSLMLVDDAALLEDLPSEWDHDDVGDPQHAGTAGLKDDQYIVIGSGNDIYGAADAFHFAFVEIEGDVEFTARISSIGKTHDSAKAGLMIRETLDKDSRNAMVGTTVTFGTFFQTRGDEDDITSTTSGIVKDIPGWIKLIRIGDEFFGYESADGEKWNLIGSEFVYMDELFYMGFAVTSHNNNALCSTYFDNVQINTTNVHVVESGNIMPNEFELRPAYPNPFNPQTTLSFNLPEKSKMQLNVYNIRGELVQQLINDSVNAGLHRIIFDASRLSSGLYLYKIDATGDSGEDFHAVKKMTVLK